MPRTDMRWRTLKGRGFAAEVAKTKAALPQGTLVEVWFQDEARIGQKNKITRHWAGRGTRPSEPKDQRTKSAYIFGAICPKIGKGAGVVLSLCNNQTMSLHMRRYRSSSNRASHGVLLMGRARWHMTGNRKCRRISAAFRCRRNGRSSTPLKIFSSSCAITGCPTGSSLPTTTSSTAAATPGTG